MPLYHYKCPSCGARTRKILEPTAAGFQDCGVCGVKLEREPTAATAQVVETLDNGIMPRRIERLADAERMYKERSKTERR